MPSIVAVTWAWVPTTSPFRDAAKMDADKAAVQAAMDRFAAELRAIHPGAVFEVKRLRLTRADIPTIAGGDTDGGDHQAGADSGDGGRPEDRLEDSPAGGEGPGRRRSVAS
ncbi:MAG: hypothetical protein AB7O45_10215 [Alphaproteobacteria bacterium]